MRRLLPLVAVPLAGCLLSSSVQTARPIGAGNVQVGLEPGASGVAISDVTAGPLVLPTFNLAFRFGVSERVDLGARIGTTLYEITGKVLLNDPDDGALVALAPSTSVFALGDSDFGVGYWDAKLPLLVGVPVGRSELVLGPRAHSFLLLGRSNQGSRSVGVLAAGGQIGFAAHVAKGFRLLPEVAIEYPVLGTVAADGDRITGFLAHDVALFSVTLGILVGGR